MMNLLIALGALTAPSFSQPSHDTVGQPVDIAPSAYQYRSDRPAERNDPESWLALMRVAGLPLNHAVDRKNPEVRKAMVGLLWEEIRPIQTIELTWPKRAKRVPSPGAIQLCALMNRGSSSSWWNNLVVVRQPVDPVVTTESGTVYRYAIGQETCGLVVSVTGAHSASDYDVPVVRAIVPDRWKKMDVELEWGFDPGNADKDYSGRVEVYDGRISNVEPIDSSSDTSISAPLKWTSKARGASRRGVKMSLLYMGKSSWRKRVPYTSQGEDVARTIVTVWTKSGNFSFLASDLDRGPILAPEYGFFVRRASAPSPAAHEAPMLDTVPATLLSKMDAIAGDSRLKGWGSDDTPWFGANGADEAISPLGIELPARSVAMHPGESRDVVAEWRSPINGAVSISGRIAHAQIGGKGVEWWLIGRRSSGKQVLAFGKTNGTGGADLEVPGQAPGARKPKGNPEVAVQKGDCIDLVIGPNGDHRCCTMLLDFSIRDTGTVGRAWDLAKDVASDVEAENPHRDGAGDPGVWRFCSEMPMVGWGGSSDEPPLSLASSAASAAEFERELASKRLSTIRERTREHSEQTWMGAVTSTRGQDLPPHPTPPADFLPAMQVQVPSERLTAQWNLGTWHLVRHCAVNPKTGKRWFNDFPYGILAAETYLVLSVLDQMGAHEAAADGFDQWLSLPLERNPPDHPVGLFSEGYGALNHAEGPDGYGGNMDVIHAFGPGSIGWALTQHYWMTGDRAWLKANASRMIANAEWMLRQRQVLCNALPGGSRLWCKGLQPALQVTPDSGGLWMQFYECEAYYWASVSRLADTVSEVDPVKGAQLKAEAEAYRKDLREAVERSIALSPVVPVRDGTYHSVIPFACYVRGPATGAWGWERDGSGSHVGPLYWDTVQSAAALISPAGLLPANDVRVQGYFDVLEDRFLLENQNVGDRDWFGAGWQYQGGLERQANMYLAADDIPVFLRSFLNCYAVDILPKDGYVFNEHAVHGPPDKIFEEAAFLERFRNLLVMEDRSNLWLARGTPKEWLADGKSISVRHAPTAFGEVSYQIVSHESAGTIEAMVDLPARRAPKEIWLRLRHPKAARIESVTVDRKPWKDFDQSREVVKLHGLSGTVQVVVQYR
ncbi:MAG: hypothetical protein P4L46_13085 [Fimbriimonas sp.]|nr:hypothetical protein [Fimbriimonas sp.]